jgi:ERCC4-type nuclease
MGISAIYIDSREADWVKSLTFGGLPVTVTFLEAGDVMAATDDGNLILVERKSPSDFLNTLREDRLFPQMANMTLQTRWAYLLVTGELLRAPNGNVIADRGETGWSWNAVQGALITCQELGIFVVFCGGDQDYESAILRLGGRDRNAELKLGPAKLPKILNIQEQVLASLPGIGVERVGKLLEYAGTPGWAICALTDNSSHIPGVPDGVKKRVRSVLGLLDTEQLGVMVEQNQEVLAKIELGSQ